MELKLGKGSACLYCRFVLIVPYGIEIQQYRGKPYPDQVLIVPYGIEIRFPVRTCNPLVVLIVPYGIEITFL